MGGGGTTPRSAPRRTPAAAADDPEMERGLAYLKRFKQLSNAFRTGTFDPSAAASTKKERYHASRSPTSRAADNNARYPSVLGVWGVCGVLATFASPNIHNAPLLCSCSCARACVLTSAEDAERELEDLGLIIRAAASTHPSGNGGGDGGDGGGGGGGSGTLELYRRIVDGEHEWTRSRPHFKDDD